MHDGQQRRKVPEISTKNFVVAAPSPDREWGAFSL